MDAADNLVPGTRYSHFCVPGTNHFEKYRAHKKYQQTWRHGQASATSRREDTEVTRTPM